jgi:hypothetical protein
MTIKIGWAFTNVKEKCIWRENGGSVVRRIVLQQFRIPFITITQNCFISPCKPLLLQGGKRGIRFALLWCIARI